MDIPSSTTLILDLRDRMARIETKLDEHHREHAMIDRAFELVGKRIEAIETRQDAEATKVNDIKADIAVSRAKVAMLVTIGTSLVAGITYFAEHIWGMLKLT
jgi:chromosome segregation ATPase